MTSWKISLPCTRAEAEAIELEDDLLGHLEPPPVLLTRERVVDDPDAWQLEAYFAHRPNHATIAAVRALAPSATTAEPAIERINDADWVTLSQAGLDPVIAGRFFVYASSYTGAVPRDCVPFRIEASRAFGTGHHETTAGCLAMLDAMRRRGARVDHLIDLGTGTGLLAFAAMQLWPRAYATATDIDPIAIEMADEFAETNGIPLGLGIGKLALEAAPGTAGALTQRRAPYDLIIANILAVPLIELAADVTAIAAPGAQLVLAGLLGTQAEAVARAYRRRHWRLAERIDRGDWAILRLRRRP